MKFSLQSFKSIFVNLTYEFVVLVPNIKDAIKTKCFHYFYFCKYAST